MAASKKTTQKNALNTEKTGFEDNIKKLQDIVAWLESHDEVDLEKSLEKIKEGSALLKACKKDLKEIDNIFSEVEKDLEK